MSRNDYNYLSKVSGMILKYSALLIGIVYFIGYLYIVGVNIAFDNGQLTSIYSFNRIYFLSNTYLLVGIKYIIFSGFFLGLILAVVVFGAIIFGMKNKKYEVYKNKLLNSNIIYGILMYLIFFYLISLNNNDYEYFIGAILFILIMYILSVCMLSIFSITTNKAYKYFCNSFIDGYDIAAILFFTVFFLLILIKSIELEGGNLELLKILLFIISIFIFISIEVSIQNSKNVSEKIIISSLKIFLEFLIFMIIFSCTIVYDGALWTIQKLEDYNENGQKIEFSEVYTSDGQVNEYICIENNGSNFIGFNVKKGQVENLSFNSISKIEYVNKCKIKEIKKYNEKEASGEEKQIAKLINDYYKVMKDNDKAISWIKKNSLTTYYEDKYNNINPELLDKQYNVSDEKHKMADFIGQEVGKPEEEANNDWTVKVVETWKESNRYKSFSLCKCGNDFYIRDISVTEEFNFSTPKNLNFE